MVKIVIDNSVLDKYHKYYFMKYPKRKKKPIDRPIPPSLNTWLIMKRQAQNSLKGKWNEFIKWYADEQQIAGLQINSCDVEVTYYFDSRRKHDADNFTPKKIFDGLVASGVLVGDDFGVIHSLTIRGGYDKDNPRTEIIITSD